MLEEDVDELPELVVGRLQDLLADEGVVGVHLEGLLVDHHLGWPDLHPDVARLGHGGQPSGVADRHRGQRPLADQDRMDELDRVVLGVAERGSRLTVNKEPASGVEASGHPPAGAGELGGSCREEAIPGLLHLLVVAANRRAHLHVATHAWPRLRPPSLAGTCSLA